MAAGAGRTAAGDRSEEMASGGVEEVVGGGRKDGCRRRGGHNREDGSGGVDGDRWRRVRWVRVSVLCACVSVFSGRQLG